MTWLRSTLTGFSISRIRKRKILSMMMSRKLLPNRFKIDIEKNK
jgi:hypothetical protein